MSRELLLYIVLFLFGVFISAFSQVLLKKAAKVKYDSWIREYLNVRVIVAYGIFFLATLCSVYAYKVVPLSMGPILDAMGYIFVTIFGVTVFKERMNLKKGIALGLILVGIVIFSVWG